MRKNVNNFLNLGKFSSFIHEVTMVKW
jgi:hypothetical protein